MAEAIISRRGKKDNSLSPPPIVQGRCQLLVYVTDSDNVPISNLSVHCRDGASWYNYHTNDKGQVLFSTTSGAANITAWNFSINGNYKWIDQSSNSINIDAPIGTSNIINLNLGLRSSFTASSMSSNIYNEVCYTGSYMTRHYNRGNLFIGGGGGGGGHQGAWDVCSGGGGGGGGANSYNRISISKNTKYNFYIAEGGNGGNWNHIGGYTGGTTSAFGYTAIGGNGGQAYGLSGSGWCNHGVGMYNTGDGGRSSAQRGNPSALSNFGGGGAGSHYDTDSYPPTGGSPFGGDCGWYSGGAAKGPGGGGGSSSNVRQGSVTEHPGGKGGPGMISITFY